jgi:hypothetical protein
MSSMLEQAIIDAAALREAALKNAEQSLIEKYAPQIKEAVESMLENESTNEGYKGKKVKYEGQIAQITTEAENGMVGISLGGKTHLVNESELEEVLDEELLNEEDIGMDVSSPAASDAIQAPFAANPQIEPNQPVDLSVQVDALDDVLEIDLARLEKELASDEMEEEDLTSIPELADEEEGLEDLLAAPEAEETETAEEEAEEADEEELQLQELLNLLEEQEEVIEEEAKADMGATKAGWITTDVAHNEYEQDMQMAADNLNEAEGEEEEKEDDKTPELYETIDLLKTQNEKLESVVLQLNDKLEETLLSNAKLIYQNRTLADASLNERQKQKIVEAIAKAESPKEAKQLHETLTTTVGSDQKKGPQSLSESVNRRSNLSGILNRRQNLNENQSSNPFFDKMRKLAGIK